MAKKISELTEATTLVDPDLLPVVKDVGAGILETQKVTFDNLVTEVGDDLLPVTAVAPTAPDDGDLWFDEGDTTPEDVVVFDPATAVGNLVTVKTLDPPVLEGLDSGAYAPRTFLYLPGIGNNNLSAPDSVGLSVTGDLDIRVKVRLDDWGAPVSKGLNGKDAASNRSWIFWLDATTARPRLYWSPDGTTSPFVVATTSPAATDGVTWLWYRVTLDVDNGAGGNDVTFYTSLDGTDDPDAVTWVQLGATITTAGTTSIFDGTAPVYWGTYDGGSASLKGGIRAGAIYNGIGGTKVGSVDLTVPVGPRYRDGQGNVWTLNGSAYSWMVL